MLFSEILPQDAMKIPIVSCIGYSNVDCKYGPVIRNQYIIHYVLTGKGYFNGKPVAAGQGFIIMPGMEIEYSYDEKDPWSYLWFKSSDDDIIPFLNMHAAVDGVFNYSNMEEILSVVNRVKIRANQPTTSTEITEFFVHVFNECIVRGKSTGASSYQKYCNYCKKYIDLNLDKPITVESLCEIVGVTQPYLYKIFKSELGISPKQYIISKKLQQAKNMLSSTDAPISVVASSLGFGDTISFSKFFKSTAGISPSEFRNSK